MPEPDSGGDRADTNALSKTATWALEAAELRIRRGGYYTVSYRDLASDLNIKSSSVNYHFSRKEEMAVCLIDRCTNRMFSILAEFDADAESPLDKLQALRATYEKTLNRRWRNVLVWAAGFLNRRTSPIRARSR